METKLYFNLGFLLVYTFTLKLIRLIESNLSLTLLQYLDFFKFDLLWFVVAFYFMRELLKRFSQPISVTLSYLFIVTYFVIEVCGHSFYMQSGEHVDFSLIIFALKRINKFLDLARGENSLFFLLFNLLFFLLLTLNHFFQVKFISNLKFPRLNSFHHSSKQWWGVLSFGLFFFLIFQPNFSNINQSLNRGPFFSSFNLIDFSVFRSVNSLPEQKLEMEFVQNYEAKPLQKNVAIIILESTRARSVDPYTRLKVTPYFEQIASQGILAKYAYSVIPHTSKSLVNILCGVYPNISTDVNEAKPGTIPTPCLAKVLSSKLDYETAYFQAATENFESRRSLVKIMGYKNFYPLESMNQVGYEKANYFGLEDNVMLPKSLEWLKKVKKSGKPFLATYLTVTPHFHYRPVKRYGQFKFHSHERYNAYLNSLRYQDHFLKNLIDQYKKLGLFKDTIFFIMGDHGETFKIDHGTWGHGDTAYQEGLRVPFLVYNYRSMMNRVVKENVILMDTVPTILNLLGLKIKNNRYHGLNMLEPIPSDRLSFFHGIRPTYAIGLINGQLGLKYIHWYNRVQDRVYDIINDPLERFNLISQYSEDEVNQFKEVVFNWKREVKNFYRKK